MISTISCEDNLDILHDDNYLLCLLNRNPEIGDILVFNDMRFTVTSVERIDTYKHNWKIGITGEEILKLREILTYKVACKFCDCYATHKVSTFKEIDYRLVSTSYFACSQHVSMAKNIDIVMELDND